jgi:hypothetical protein
MRKIILSLLFMIVLGCGSATEPDDADLTTGMRVALSTVAFSGAEYRLTKGTFSIRGTDLGGAPLLKVVSVDPDDDSPTLDVAVAPGSYQVKLEDGWELSVSTGGPFTPVSATLQGESSLDVWVNENQATQVNFPFILGKAGLSLGITVDENFMAPEISIPDGYEGVIVERSDGWFYVLFPNNGAACCWPSVADVRLSYPGRNFYYRGD